MVGEEQLADLRTWAQISRDLVTALGILVAGGFSYYTFVLGRSFAPNVQMQFALKQVIDSADGKVAVVSVKVKNTGRTDVRTERCLICYKAIAQSPPSFSALVELEGLSTGVDPLTPGVKWKDMFADLAGLEPGEEDAEQFVVALGGSVVFKVAGNLQMRPRFARARIWWRRFGDRFGRSRGVRIKVRTANSGEIFDIRRLAEEDQPEAGSET